jgi:hypothetical protein
MMTHPCPGQIAQTLFPDLDLGDKRRNRRFAKVVEALAVGGGHSLPTIFSVGADYDACLRLFDADEANHERILSAHQVAVLHGLETVTTPVLMIHDATTLDFLSIEGCQFQSAKKMQAFVAVMSVVSVMLLNLRLAARDPERSGRPAEQYLPRLWVVVLEQLKVRQRPLETVRDFWLHLAWLGGYMRDKPDRDPPGWQTLWRGWLRFQIILQYELSRAKM